MKNVSNRCSLCADIRSSFILDFDLYSLKKFGYIKETNLRTQQTPDRLVSLIVFFDAVVVAAHS